MDEKRKQFEVNSWVESGKSWIERSDLHKAEKSLKKAIDLIPDHKEASALLKKVHELLRKDDVKKQKVQMKKQELDNTRRDRIESLVTSDLMKRFEDLDIVGVKKKLSYITWEFGWHSALETLTITIAKQKKATDADIESILRGVFETNSRKSLKHSQVLELLSKCPETNDFDDVLKWVQKSKIGRPRSSKSIRPDTPGGGLSGTLRIGDGVSKQDLHELSISVFGEAIEEKPANILGNSLIEQQYNFGLESLVLKKYDEAEQIFQAYIGTNESIVKSGAFSNLGIALAKQGKFAEAGSSFRESIKLKPNQIQSWFNLGLLYNKMEQFSVAELHFKKSGYKPDTFDDESIEVHWMKIGDLLFRSGNDETKEVLLRKLVSLYPKDSETCENLGKVLLVLEKTVEGKMFSNRAKILHKSKMVSEDYYMATFSYEGPYSLQPFTEGCKHLMRHRKALPRRISKGLSRTSIPLKKAETSFRKAIKLRKNEPYLWYTFGYALALMNNFAEAENAFRKTLELQSAISKLPDAHWIDYYWHSDPAAIIGFSELSKIEDNSMFGLLTKPALDRRGGWFGFYKWGIVRHPDAYVWLMLGTTLANQEKNSEAVTAYIMAIKLQEEGREIWRNLRVIMAGQNQSGDLEKKFREAIAYQPAIAAPWYELGIFLAQQRNYTKALEAFEEVLKIDVTQPSVWFRVGVLNLFLQDAVEGENALDKAVELFDHTPLFRSEWRDFLLKVFNDQKQIPPEFMIELFEEKYPEELRVWRCMNCNVEFDSGEKLKVTTQTEFQCHSCGHEHTEASSLTRRIFELGHIASEPGWPELENLFRKYINSSRT